MTLSANDALHTDEIRMRWQLGEKSRLAEESSCYEGMMGMQRSVFERVLPLLSYLNRETHRQVLRIDRPARRPCRRH